MGQFKGSLSRVLVAITTATNGTVGGQIKALNAVGLAHCAVRCIDSCQFACLFAIGGILSHLSPERVTKQCSY